MQTISIKTIIRANDNSSFITAMPIFNFFINGYFCEPGILSGSGDFII